jgi:Ca-activated chloride channel family protein
VVPLKEILIAIQGALAEWWRVRWNDLHFAEAQTALLLLVVLLAMTLVLLLARNLRSRRAGGRQVTLPAILPVMQRSALSATRHAAFLVFLAGVPFFAVALGDPRTSFTREDVTYPGRRIAVLIDGSGSMVLRFETSKLRPQDGRAFYTAVAAAEHFVKLRMNGPYRDLIGLIEFGAEAYVLTPFTTDYENILLSLKLAGNPKAWGRFDDAGTVIIRAIEQSNELFKAFDFLKASGNLVVILSDANDGEATFRGRTLDEITAEARKSEIPVYMVRVGFNKKIGEGQWDLFWKRAVERTGGRFYAASNEAALVTAVSEIDRLSAGRIDVRHYSSERPRFSGYALVAVGLWLVAGGLKLGFRSFQTFP